MAEKLQMCGTEAEMREVAARICRNYLYGAWKTVDPEQLDFRKMSGGLSNFLYYVALPDDVTKLECYRREQSPDAEKKTFPSISSFCMAEPRKVLLRIYGQVHGERAMDAIVTESVIFTLLSERKLGPKLYGVFSGGRIEEYIPARSLCHKELSEPAISMKIAEKMAAIHSMDVPLSKEPNWLWKTTGKWWKTTKEDRWVNTVAKNDEEKRILKILKSIDFEKELEWLKKLTDSVESPIVFCHNDMQEGNILILEDTLPNSEDEDYTTSYSDVKSDKGNDHRLSSNFNALYDDSNTSDDRLSYSSDNGEPRLVLIDFEYCAYNHRGFDIANHFQEWGYEYTNTEYPYYFEHHGYCPTMEHKEIFIKEYLKHYHANLDKEPPTIDDINKLFTEVEAFELASHLFWCLWTTNSSTSQIPFGYWEYALSRYERYRQLKQELIKKDKLGFPQKRKICEVDI
ncbi:choline/ethanolamine kinase isoform X2 [Amyelois transitella]|uniref:choline/ethanolamine kinase isoform X2 n=1 Tax=Amyelois transitella TaxID=680683 RepID=UPI00067E5D83|nr:choline/ethanolamine kinase isoform X2 [Amyelois transitella]